MCSASCIWIPSFRPLLYLARTFNRSLASCMIHSIDLLSIGKEAQRKLTAQSSDQRKTLQNISTKALMLHTTSLSLSSTSHYTWRRIASISKLFKCYVVHQASIFTVLLSNLTFHHRHRCQSTRTRTMCWTPLPSPWMWQLQHQEVELPEEKIPKESTQKL